MTDTIDLDLDGPAELLAADQLPWTYSAAAVGKVWMPAGHRIGPLHGDYIVTITKDGDYSNASVISNDPTVYPPGLDDDAPASAMWDVWYHNLGGEPLTLAMFFGMGEAPLFKGKACRVCRWPEHVDTHWSHQNEALLRGLRLDRPYECLDTYLYGKAYDEGLTLDQIGARFGGQSKGFIKTRLDWDGFTLRSRGRSAAA